MAVDFFLDPGTISLPTLSGLRNGKWARCPSTIRSYVAQEDQYLDFHLRCLDQFRFTAEGSAGAVEKPYSCPLDLSVRAGSVKAAILIAASIVEAVLRAVAEHRGYMLPPNKRHRTFGKVLGAWCIGGNPRQEMADVWSDLQDLRDFRNNIHLFVAAEQGHSFGVVLARESELLYRASNLVNHMSSLNADEQ